MHLARTTAFLLLLLLSGAPAFGQDSTRATGDALRLFLDCDDCDFTYIRRQIPWVNYVRDRESAQIHVLVTEQRTGGGGDSYNLAFIGRQEYAGMDATLKYVSAQGDTDDEERQGFTQVLRLGLLPYISQTPMGRFVKVEVDESSTGETRRETHDPWNNWVFRANVNGWYDEEARERQLSYSGGFSADRVTERWKWRNEAGYSFNEERFEDDDRFITATRRSGELNSLLVRSLSDHWSAGLSAGASTSTYSNIALGLYAAPAVEYNVFPWEVSDRKMLTLAYRAGIQARDYEERTLYNKTSELLAYESLGIGLGLKQPWGEVDLSLSGFHYFHDFTKRRLELDAELDVRITRGLSVSLDVGIERIHDQLYLPAGEATLEEILLRRRRLATTYEFSAGMGLRYTFGSIYNNVVNLRL